jgi:RHS repeat-associated protein
MSGLGASSSSTRRVLASFVPWLVGGLIIGAAARAPAETEVEAFSASFRTSVPIGLPSYQGLEPKLSLQYMSALGNGFAGVGWSLSGVSTIERMSPRRGAPALDASDGFFMDGQELIPSTELGGTHATRVQSYARVTRDQVNDKWYVWSKDGTKATYSPLVQVTTPVTTCTRQLATVSTSGAGLFLPDATWFAGTSTRIDTYYTTSCGDGFTCDSDILSLTLGGVSVAGSLGGNFNVTGDGNSLIGWWETCSDGNCSTVESGRIFLDGAIASGAVKGSVSASGTSWTSEYTTACGDGDTCVNDGGTMSFAPDSVWAGCTTTTPTITLRWALTAMTDMLGRTVSYGFECEGTDECYLTTVSYNGTVVKLYREARTDVITYGRGPQVGRMAKRLKTIDVCVGNPASPSACAGTDTRRARTYALTYAYSTATGRSVIQTIQQFGRDAVLDAAGAVTAGSSLPPSTYVTSASTNNLNAASNTAWLAATCPSGVTYNTGYQFTGDFNGDGKTDYLFFRAGWWVALSNGNGFNAPTVWLGVVSPGGGNTYKLNYQFVGDFNGDGRADFMYWNAGWWVATANAAGTGFNTPVKWVVADGPQGKNNADVAGRQYVADFDGDGATDLLFFRAGWYLLTGKRDANGAVIGFNAPVRWLGNYAETRPTWGQCPNSTIWIDCDGAFATTGRFAVDLDGDGRTDLLYLTGNGWYAALSQGTYASRPRQWLTGVGPGGYSTFRTDSYMKTADINGDGKTDFLYLTSAGWYVALSTGRAFTVPTFALAKNITGYGNTYNDPYNFLVDVNGDGRADWLFFAGSAATANGGPGWYVARSNGDTGFGAPSLWLARGGPAGYYTYNNGKQYLADFTGDGKPDWMFYGNAWYVATSKPVSDLVTQISNNGLGGKTTVAYKPSSAWPSNKLPEGLVLQTAWTVTVDDGRGTAESTATSTYTYEGAKWDFAARDFLGFRKAVTTLDATGAWSETYYWQRVGSIAKPEVIYKKRPLKSGESPVIGPSGTSESARVLSFEKFVFEENAVAPYTSRVKQVWAYTCEGAAVFDAGGNYVSGCRRVFTEYDWDLYGNMLREKQYGDYDVTGDERTAERAFAYNLTAYIVGLQYYEKMFAGIGNTGTLLAATYFYYDGGGACGTPPTVGKLAFKGAWNDRTGGYHFTSLSNDGTVEYAADPTYQGTVRYFDPTYKVYVVKTCDDFEAYCSSSVWDTTLGVETSRTDVNGQSSSYYYDALGRITKKTSPGGAQVRYEYLNYGTATTQKQRTWLTVPGVGEQWEDNYLDGLGRVYLKVGQTGDATKVLVSRTLRDKAGKPWKAYQPYLAAATDTTFAPLAGQAYTFDEYTYDELGRTLTAKKADGATTAKKYYVTATAIYDPAANVGGLYTGQPRWVYSDAWGQHTMTAEWVNGAWQHTWYEYDVLGRRINVFDSVGGYTYALYDSLGRVYERGDGDKGVWHYGYDDAGRLTTETDALGLTTTLAHDYFGRVYKRTYADGTWDSFTFDEPSGGYAVGRLTTAVSRCAAANPNTCTPSANSVVSKAAYDVAGRRTWFSQQSYTQGFTSLGCFADSGTRDLPYYAVAGGSVSTESCVATCRAAGYQYAGTQYSTSCFCGSSYGRYGASTGCTMPCSGNPSETCGGSWANNVYRVDAVAAGPARTISHTFDSAGRMLTATYPDGEVVTYGYATTGLTLGRLTTVTGSQAGALVKGITYTARGQIASLTHGNDLVTTYGYDAYLEQPSSISIAGFAAPAPATVVFNYGFDAAGRVTMVSSPQVTTTNWAYAYDNLGRLTSAVNNGDHAKDQSFRYDGVGRMVFNSKVSGTCSGSDNYCYNGASIHAVTNVGATTYSYDANGNMIGGAGRSFTYDLDHRVATISSGGLTTAFVYDAQGVRVRKQNPSVTTEYVGGLYELRCASGTGACTTGSATKYYFAGGMRVAKRDANGTSFFHTDPLGSTRYVSDAAKNPVKRYDYRPYGEVAFEDYSRPDSHRFTGQESDDETGLIFFQSRYYDPALGRFLQPDPFLPNPENPQELDPYTYANNSPTNYVDPSGHAPVLVALGVALSATAATVINIACLVIGIALQFTGNPILASIGMVLAGMGGAAMGGPLVGLNGSMLATTLVGGAVGLAQSPVSPLDPTIKKAIGWAYTIWGGVSAINNFANGVKLPEGYQGPPAPWKPSAFMPEGIANLGRGSLVRASLVFAGWEALTTGLAMAAGALVSRSSSTELRFGFAFLAGVLVWTSKASPGPLAMLGASYDFAYTLAYPDGRVYDLSGGAQDTLTVDLYYHTGYEAGTAFGRQHIRVAGWGGYYEVGDTRTGFFGPGIGWGGWGATMKIRVILSANDAAVFRAALDQGATAGGTYVMFHADSYTYISRCLEIATGKSAADLHINPGLINW